MALRRRDTFRRLDCLVPCSKSGGAFEAYRRGRLFRPTAPRPPWVHMCHVTRRTTAHALVHTSGNVCELPTRDRPLDARNRSAGATGLLSATSVASGRPGAFPGNNLWIRRLAQLPDRHADLHVVVEERNRVPAVAIASARTASARLRQAVLGLANVLVRMTDARRI